ncbi:hypothetical protein SSABA_v1c08750 [Spiroplasma sabaudiense Ar-1343]|uniref:Lipoprotein n=1 Tax=Spiroplasma sabaudiense Ar-1343 TaxID=1276257 RepID=W6AKM7_9MOLU|nr:hypothetical protein [Spiroplasma sabaudiense]AHI54274.1 hypothetical protein SSABA_v1c08750 [Spiroplasma sabaudiense Ar-1343]
MRKFLTTLGTLSILTATPLTIISCSRKINNKDEHPSYDYEAGIQNLISTVTSIYQTNVAGNMAPYLFFYEDNSSPFSFINFSNLQKIEPSELANSNSSAFESINQDLRKIINWEQINNQLRQEVNNNPNFLPLLVNNNPPIQNGFYVSRIELQKRGVSSMSLKIEFSTVIIYRTAVGTVENLRIWQNADMNVFSNKIISENLNKIKNDLTDSFNEDKIANGFIYNSNSGHIVNSAQRIIRDETIQNQIKETISKISVPDNHYGINLNTMVKTINRDHTADASARFSIPKLYWRLSPSPTNLIDLAKKTLLKDDASTAEFLKIAQENDSRILGTFMNREIPSLENLLENDPNSSQAINQYNLNWNFGQNQLRRVLNQQGSQFKIDFSNDHNTIALFGLNISGIQIRFENTSFEIPNFTIAIRQRILLKNTRVLYQEFLKDALQFQVAFLNYSKNLENQNNSDLFYLVKTPLWHELSPNRYYDFQPLARQMFAEANARANNALDRFELTNQFAYSAWTEVHEPRFVKFNENNEIYFKTQDNQENPDFLNRLITNFFTPLSNQPATKINFTFNHRSDYSVSSSNSPSPWRLF